MATLLDLDGPGWEVSRSGLLLPAKPKKPTAVDLFCGCGGFSLGVIEAGFDVLCGVDWECAAACSYMVNLGSYPIDLRFVEESDRERFTKFLERPKNRQKGAIERPCVSGSNRTSPGGVPVFWLGDIRKLRGSQILESIGLEVGELDLVFGGPPCQGFSTVGRRDVMDPRNTLVFEFARLVCEMRPRTLCMENVPGIASMVTVDGIPVLDELAAILEKGDWGSYQATRAILQGDRKLLRRKHVGRPRDGEAKKPQGEQCELFGGGKCS